MKHVQKFLIILCLIIPLIGKSQVKRALIVAVGDYPAETKWRVINSVNDVPLIKSALLKQGFNDKEIAVLKNAEADKKKIVAAFKELTSKAQKGDIIVIHFSSHGQRITDDSDDELDGYDEAIVAYGAYTAFTDTYHGENHLRDDEIEILINDLRKKVGKSGDVLMIADACHSGTISRGEEISRGGMPPMIDTSKHNTANGKEDVGLFQETAVSRGDDEDIAPFVLISASQASQVNYEYQGAGSLSTAISRCSDNMDNNTTYRSFFAQIMKEMSQLAPNQIPAIEGDIDRTLFAGRAVKQEPYYMAYKIREMDINISGGTLNGLFPNTEIAIFPAGTANMGSATPIATGKIINAEGTWSKAKLDKTLPGSVQGYWIFVTKQTYGDIKVKVMVNTGNKASNDEITAALSDFSLVQLVSEKADFEINDGGRGNVDLTRASDKSLFSEGISISNQAEELKEEIKNFAKGRYIKDLDLKYPGIDVSFEFIPVRIDQDDDITDTLTIEDISVNGIITVSPSIAVLIKVTNNGLKPAYFGIVDIQPNGVINGIIPDPNPQSGHTKEQFLIEPKKSYIIPNHKVVFGPPYGEEVFKLFATSKDPVDFRPILSGLGRTRSEMTELDLLFDDSLQAASRGGESTTVKSNMEASTYSIGFRIVED